MWRGRQGQLQASLHRSLWRRPGTTSAVHISCSNKARTTPQAADTFTVTNAMQRTLEARLNPRSIHILDTKAKSTPRGAETQRQRQAQRRRIAASQPLPPRALAPENINPFALKSKQKHSQFVYPCAYFPVSYSTERSISWSAIPPLPASSFRVVVITFSFGETGERGRVRKRRQTLQVGRPRAGQQAVEKET